MSDRIPGGYMLVAKKIFNSELMRKPPLYSKLFLWMLSQASFKTTRNLERGEFVTSISEMQEAMTYYVGYRKEMPTIKQIRSIYKWFANKSTGDATKGTMIVTTKVTGGLRISISNYDYYQSPANYEGHNEGHDERATGGHTLQATPYNKKEVNILSRPSNGIPYQKIISRLNEKANKNFKHSAKDTQRLIKVRWNEGFTFEDFCQVIDSKCSKWLTDAKMVDYLRPQTLFGTKFESYLNESPTMFDKSEVFL
jgi:uncharacterized phage protein (TIGR02220 family)